MTRFEQDDPRITYTGVWYPNNNSLESGGSALLANLKGSQAIVTFNGTGITWIGESDYYAGICYVTIDGAPRVLDTSNPTNDTLYQRPLLTIRGLSPGVHRMTIEVIHSHDAQTNASWIWIDAFEVENGTLVRGPLVANAGMAQQTDVAVNYSGLWFQNTGSQYLGGSINLAVDAGARIDFTFSGTSVTWIGYRDEWSGMAQVFLDGALQANVDTYLSPPRGQTAVYTLSNLSPGTHTLDILALGTHSAASGGSWIWVDGFQVSGAAVAPSPAIASGGIVDAASFAVGAVSPGQIVSIFGQNFLSGGSASATAYPLPAQLGPLNTTVTACGRTLPLYNVFPGQINAQIPIDCPSAGSMTVTVSVGGQTATQTFTLLPAAPGIFTINGSGTGDGIVVHADNTLVNSARPASAGEQVIIYASGLGATSPTFASGAAANQFNMTLMPVAVTIGGKDATVLYSGLTQGFAGLYQINVILPSGLSGVQPISITVGGRYTSRSGITTWMK